MVCVGRVRLIVQGSGAGMTASRSKPVRVKRRSQLRSLDDFDVTRAAADIAAERCADVILSRIRIAAQQPDSGHDETRRAVATLGSKLFMKAALRRRQSAIAAQSFDGFHMMVHRADCERQTGEP